MSSTSPSEASGSSVDTHELSHISQWQSVVNLTPNKIALISCDQHASAFQWIGSAGAAEGHVEWTFSELDKAARRLATTLNRLAPIGTRPIATLINSQAEWALFFWAAAYLHVPLMPINPKCATRSEEISHMLRLMKPGVIVTANAEIARQLEHSVDAKIMYDISTRLMLTTTGGPVSLRWRQLSHVMSGERTPSDTPLLPDPEAHALILFTSGTTSLPKPCALTSSQVVNAALAYTEARRITSDHRLVHHLPGFHAYGITWGLVFWLAGGSVVYPSAAFEAQASLDCIARFKCTHTSLVPTTAQAILAHSSLAATDLSSLVSIDVSGAGVLPSIIESCEKALKVPAYTSYGMTESPGTIIWPEGGGSVLKDGEVLSGYPSRGVTARVCEPGTRDIVPRGQPGELHCTGIQVISGYLDATVSSDAFYVDNASRQWVISGDQAIMSEDGAICIVGRYKDLIIRGGENISPASIENLLSRIEGVEMCQVIGVPDDMAGEVPIAVIKSSRGWKIDSNLLKQMATSELGPAFAPKLILDLHDDLGLDMFPLTASGKVRKVELRELVRDHLVLHRQSVVKHSGSTVEALVTIWAGISGAESLLPTTSILSFADSLMMMQLSGTVKAELKKDITVEDFKTCETIQDQANLIDLRARCGTKTTGSRRKGPPTIDDVSHVQGIAAAFEETKSQVDSAITSLGLSWSDVEDVMPLPDWEAIFLNKTRPQSWNLRWTYHAAVDAQRLEAAVKQTLAFHPTMRSIGLEQVDKAPLLVTVRPTEAWFESSMTSGWTVDTKEDLSGLLLGHPVLDCATSPGPLLRIHVASIREDGTSGLVVVGSHSIVDASMTKLWLDDMAAALIGTANLVHHGLYKDYCAAYHDHKSGTEAERGLQYWTTKLAGVGSLPETTYWPQQRAPEWFKGCDHGWTRWDGRKASESQRSVRQSDKVIAQKGIRRMVKVQDLLPLKAKHNVPVFMLVKAAVALLNIKMTAGQEAVFGTMNAARTWPFKSDFSTTEAERYSGNPLDISGCTIEYVLDRVAVDLEITALAFLQRVTRDEETNSTYAHTPFLSIVERMRQPVSMPDPRSHEHRDADADALLGLVRRQSFNWLPTNPMAQSNGSSGGLQMLEMLTRMDNGLTITGFVADDKRSVALSFTWDAEHMTLSEAESAIEVLAGFVIAMGREENWGRMVGEMM